MAKNLGVTPEVFRMLTKRQKTIVQKNFNKDMALLHRFSNPRIHAQALGFGKVTIIKLKSGAKIIIKRGK